jgi:hypothetical protein
MKEGLARHIASVQYWSCSNFGYSTTLKMKPFGKANMMMLFHPTKRYRMMMKMHEQIPKY